MTIILDANVCLFHETYLMRGSSGGRELAQILLAWLAIQFPGILSFELYLAGDIDRLLTIMNRSWVGLPPSRLVEFMAGLAQSVNGGVEFKTGEDIDKASFFSRLLQDQAGGSEQQQVLLGASTRDLRSIFEEEEKRKESLGEIALLKTVESLEETELGEFQRISNNRIFRDQLYAAEV